MIAHIPPTHGSSTRGSRWEPLLGPIPTGLAHQDEKVHQWNGMQLVEGSRVIPYGPRTRGWTTRRNSKPIRSIEMYNYNPRGHLSSPTVLGIDERVERVLCYVLGWVSGLIFLVIEQRNHSVRRHALQSVIVFGVLTVILAIINLFGSVLGSIFLIGWIFSFGLGLLHALVWIVGALLWIGLMLAAYFSPATFITDRGSRYV